MNTHVNFEISKLLKEKGFGSMTEPKSYNIVQYLFLAPTIAEVVMWLYEKHGVWVECLHRGDMGDFTFKVSKLKKGWRTEPNYIHESGFTSPTEAYEAAITYILNNLI